MTVRERISYAIRIAVSHTLYYTGVLRAIVRLRLRRKTVVLAYHRVLTPAQRALTASQQGLIVDDRTFARHIALLSQVFRVLTLNEFADHMARRVPFQGPACLITFDDGWIDNLENALPVLRSRNAPAVMFLPVNFIGRRRLFTREALTHLLVRVAKISRAVPDVRAALRAHLTPFRLESVLDIDAENPLPEILTIVAAHRYASSPSFAALVSTLATQLGVTDAEISDLDTFIDWEQVEHLGTHGFTFGGHGAEHYVLTEVSPSAAREEIDCSKRRLDERLRQPAQAFAYPNGQWNAQVAQSVKAAGYRLAFTIDPGHVSCDDDPFTLPRLNIHEGMTGNVPMFMARLAGIF